ncbi:hypothetical protein PED39_05410 [Methanomassiliicoccales archaeon LGM-RCC1]|nr:hypothetical protein PED39_05410 [Methanomassiliicoccales archaeon LGM-RCC1]
MTLSQDIIEITTPGRVYCPAEVAERLGVERVSNVKKQMDSLCEYHYFERWKKPKRWLGHEVYAYLRLP